MHKGISNEQADTFSEETARTEVAICCSQPWGSNLSNSACEVTAISLPGVFLKYETDCNRGRTGLVGLYSCPDHQS